ncbi:helix-turn-helix transcriptional regulator [Rhodanobacter sp. Si-c]|uniref:Helix-turn-helix transcriptional regulator n=1 Tax=Rhodanobacter lycopersici TaxID=3162487 RepID=A0ABV3Q8M0_9GAMM
MKHFGDRLREARVAAGMTQEQLGFELGVTKSSVSAWENGRETPSFRMLPELRRQLRRSLDELICGTGAVGALSERMVRDAPDETSPVARDEKERALLVRYRSLSPRQRGALLDLIKSAE